MSAYPPKEVAERDLTENEKDVARLEAITTNLRAFIFETDEDRRDYRIILMRFENDLARGRELSLKISHILELYKKPV